MRLDALLRAHAYLNVERPPVLWEARTSGEHLVPLLGELIVAALEPAVPELKAMTLNASNIEVVEDHGAGAPPAGEFVGLTLRGRRPMGSDAVWRPGHPPADGLLRRLDAALSAAEARYAYVRNLLSEGSVTVLFERQR